MRVALVAPVWRVLRTPPERGSPRVLPAAWPVCPGTAGHGRSALRGAANFHGHGAARRCVGRLPRPTRRISRTPGREPACVELCRVGGGLLPRRHRLRWRVRDFAGPRLRPREEDAIRWSPLPMVDHDHRTNDRHDGLRSRGDEADRLRARSRRPGHRGTAGVRG